jgi:hypothetical protein
MRAAVAVLGLAGCHLVFEAELDETVAPDGGADAPAVVACEPDQPFGIGARIDAEGRSVEAARFTRDETYAYVSLCPVDNMGVANKVACDLFVVQFDATAPTVAGGASMGSVNSPCYDAYPTISADGRHILYASTRNSGVGTTCGQLKVWVASSADGLFLNPDITQFAGLPAGRCGNEPYVVGDSAQAMYFSTVPCTGGVSDLRVSRGAPPTYGGSMTELVPGVNSSADEFAPVVSEDELEIFFARGSAANSRLDIFHAQRPNPAVDFLEPVKLDVQSSPGINWPVWISPDRCRLYYIQKPTQGSRAELFVARRPAPQ